MNFHVLLGADEANVLVDELDDSALSDQVHHLALLVDDRDAVDALGQDLHH